MLHQLGLYRFGSIGSIWQENRADLSCFLKDCARIGGWDSLAELRGSVYEVKLPDLISDGQVCYDTTITRAATSLLLGRGPALPRRPSVARIARTLRCHQPMALGTKPACQSCSSPIHGRGGDLFISSHRLQELLCCLLQQSGLVDSKSAGSVVFSTSQVTETIGIVFCSPYAIRSTNLRR